MSEAAVTGTGLPYRNALADLDPSAWDVVARGADERAPLVTIAIPTFRRPETLVEAVASALSQSFGEPFEIVVADNDPASRDAERLLGALPQLADANFRYLVNRENVGMYGNHNICLLAARGEWVTILHDDDLLDPEFLSTMFEELRARPDTDGLVCRKRFLDQRGSYAADMIAMAEQRRTLLHKQRMSPGLFLKYLRNGPEARRELVERVADKLLLAVYYRYEQSVTSSISRHLTAKQLFFGPLPGNIGGFVFRRSASEKVGGFYPEETPSSDHGFYIRFAYRFHLRQHRQELASIRLSSNESGKIDNADAALRVGIDMQRHMAGTVAPRWWLKLSPLYFACIRGEYRDFWQAEVPMERAERTVGFALPKERKRLLLAIRLALSCW